jgi:hypothetical protein
MVTVALETGVDSPVRYRLTEKSLLSARALTRYVTAGGAGGVGGAGGDGGTGFVGQAVRTRDEHISPINKNFEPALLWILMGLLSVF